MLCHQSYHYHPASHLPLPPFPSPGHLNLFSPPQIPQPSTHLANSYLPPTTPSTTSSFSASSPPAAPFSRSLPFCRTCLSYLAWPLLKSAFPSSCSRFEPASAGTASPVPVMMSAEGAVSRVDFILRPSAYTKIFMEPLAAKKEMKGDSRAICKEC